MALRTSLRLALAAWIFCLLSSVTAIAESPLIRLLSFNRPESDPDKEYLLEEEHGPWLIMAATFAGEGAREQAQELVIELRKKYKMDAYLHEMRFDYNDPVPGMGVDRYNNPKQMRYKRSREVDEIAVLVGNFESIDARPLRRALRKLKTAQPEALMPTEGKKSYQQLASLRMGEFTVYDDNQALFTVKQDNPMVHAFATRNPMLPQELFAPGGVDRFVEELNSDNEFSLLSCPGEYSIKVATLGGRVVIDQKQIKEIEDGGELQGLLLQAGENAATLCKELREKGYEAYEFHDKHCSIVTVGSFSSLGQAGPDGQITLAPEIRKLIDTFSPQRGPGGQATPQLIAGVPLDAQPMVVRVPRRAISADFDRSR